MKEFGNFEPKWKVKLRKYSYLIQLLILLVSLFRRFQEWWLFGGNADDLSIQIEDACDSVMSEGVASLKNAKWEQVI